MQITNLLLVGEAKWKVPGDGDRGGGEAGVHQNYHHQNHHHTYHHNYHHCFIIIITITIAIIKLVSGVSTRSLRPALEIDQEVGSGGQTHFSW